MFVTSSFLSVATSLMSSFIGQFAIPIFRKHCVHFERLVRWSSVLLIICNHHNHMHPHNHLAISIDAKTIKTQPNNCMRTIIREIHMTTSWYINAFHITGTLWMKLMGHRQMSLTNYQWYGALMFYLLLDWTNCWTNSRIAELILCAAPLLWRQSNVFQLPSN